MPNTIDFYKWVFLHVIPVCIIVPWESQAFRFEKIGFGTNINNGNGVITSSKHKRLLLGITIGKELKIKKHVQLLYKKVSKKLNALDT